MISEVKGRHTNPLFWTWINHCNTIFNHLLYVTYLWQMNTAFLYIIKFFRALQFLPFNIQITVSQTRENIWKSNIFSQIFTGIFRLLISFWLFPAVPLGHLCWSHHYFSLLPQPLLAYFTPWPGSALSSKMTINSRLILCCVG